MPAACSASGSYVHNATCFGAQDQRAAKGATVTRQQRQVLESISDKRNVQQPTAHDKVDALLADAEALQQPLAREAHAWAACQAPPCPQSLPDGLGNSWLLAAGGADDLEAGASPPAQPVAADTDAVPMDTEEDASPLVDAAEEDAGQPAARMHFYALLNVGRATALCMWM